MVLRAYLAFDSMSSTRWTSAEVPIPNNFNSLYWSLITFFKVFFYFGVWARFEYYSSEDILTFGLRYAVFVRLAENLWLLVAFE